MTKQYTRQIGELTRNGRTVFYAHVDGNRDLRSRDGAVRIESYDRNEVVRALYERGVLDV